MTLPALTSLYASAYEHFPVIPTACSADGEGSGLV